MPSKSYVSRTVLEVFHRSGDTQYSENILSLLTHISTAHPELPLSMSFINSNLVDSYHGSSSLTTLAPFLAEALQDVNIDTDMTAAIVTAKIFALLILSSPPFKLSPAIFRKVLVLL